MTHRILVVTSDPKRLAEFANSLKASQEIHVAWADSGAAALSEGELSIAVACVDAQLGVRRGLRRGGGPEQGTDRLVLRVACSLVQRASGVVHAPPLTLQVAQQRTAAGQHTHHLRRHTIHI